MFYLWVLKSPSRMKMSPLAAPNPTPLLSTPRRMGTVNCHPAHRHIQSPCDLTYDDSIHFCHCGPPFLAIPRKSIAFFTLSTFSSPLYCLTGALSGTHTIGPVYALYFTSEPKMTCLLRQLNKEHLRELFVYTRPSGEKTTLASK